MDLQKLKNKLASQCGFSSVQYGHCISCKEPFSDTNVYSEAGWRETRISQMCEKCFDRCTEEQE